MAYDFNLDLRELVKLEKRGFGRAETISLIYISSATGKTVKEVAKRRLKEKITLRDLAKEAGLDYDQLYDKARTVKTQIEAKGDSNLPPPVFEPTPTPTPVKEKKKKKKDKNKAEETTTPLPSPAPPASTPVKARNSDPHEDGF